MAVNYKEKVYEHMETEGFLCRHILFFYNSTISGCWKPECVIFDPHKRVRFCWGFVHIRNLKSLKNIPGALIPRMQTSASCNNCITFRPSVSRKFLCFCIICWNIYKNTKFLLKITAERGKGYVFQVFLFSGRSSGRRGKPQETAVFLQSYWHFQAAMLHLS